MAKSEALLRHLMFVNNEIDNQKAKKAFSSFERPFIPLAMVTAPSPIPCILFLKNNSLYSIQSSV